MTTPKHPSTPVDLPDLPGPAERPVLPTGDPTVPPDELSALVDGHQVLAERLEHLEERALQASPVAVRRLRERVEEAETELLGLRRRQTHLFISSFGVGYAALLGVLAVRARAGQDRARAAQRMDILAASGHRLESDYEAHARYGHGAR